MEMKHGNTFGSGYGNGSKKVPKKKSVEPKWRTKKIYNVSLTEKFLSNDLENHKKT